MQAALRDDSVRVRAARVARRPGAARRGLAQALRCAGSRARPLVRDPPRRMLRTARTERRGQDDDAALLPRPDRAERRHDRDRRRAGARGGPRRAHPRGRRAAARQPRSGLHRRREPARLRPLLQHSGERAARADSEAPRLRRPRGQGQAEPPHAFRRHETPAHARACADQRPGPADPRRADDGARSAGAPPDLGRPAPAAVAGQDDPAHDALHGRGRAARDAARRHRPRQR